MPKTPNASTNAAESSPCASGDELRQAVVGQYAGCARQRVAMSTARPRYTPEVNPRCTTDLSLGTTILVVASSWDQVCVAGLMLAFSRNWLLGSYWFLSCTSRA
jgi:hypothetical protein